MISVPKTDPVSWWHLVVALERYGYTHAAIAEAVGSTRCTVENWKNRGARPRHDHGEGLIDLWAEVTGKRREDLPRQPRLVSAAKIEQTVRRIPYGRAMA